MKERPILFSAPMVRAILDGRKTQTRRVVKLNAAGRVKESGSSRNWHLDDPNAVLACPYGQPGDRLWVRETWHGSPHFDCLYRADYADGDVLAKVVAHGGWKPSIHMPRWASRITLEVTDVRVERLQDISEVDAKAEGASFHDGMGIGHSGWRHDFGDVHDNARSAYARLWNDINSPGSWDANPWVWVVEFRGLP